jgi:uncharacterized DUF497 family protein
MKYLWDIRKAAANRRKHDVSFAAAREVVADPGRLEFFDDRFPYGEERLQIVGRSV